MRELLFEDLNEKALCSIANRLGQLVFPGAFIALYGDLGAGKTTFTRALAESLDISDIQSPTFTIVREHRGRLPLLHFDAYRLSGAEELFAIGFDDYLSQNAVIVMEWCENVLNALPGERLEIRFAGSGMDLRSLQFCALGAKYENLLEKIL